MPSALYSVICGLYTATKNTIAIKVSYPFFAGIWLDDTDTTGICEVFKEKTDFFHSKREGRGRSVHGDAFIG